MQNVFSILLTTISLLLTASLTISCQSDTSSQTNLPGGGGDGDNGSNCVTEIVNNSSDDDCDGVVDEIEVSFESATTTASDLQSLVNNASSGDIYELSADGDLSLSSAVTITTGNITVFADSSSPVHLKGDGSYANIIMIDADNITLQGLEVSNGTGDLIYQVNGHTGTQLIDLSVHDSSGDECIQLKYCTDCIINRVEAYNCSGDGINFSNSSNVTLKNSTVYNSTSANGFIQLSEVNGATLENIEIKNNGDSGNRAGSGAGLFVYKGAGTHSYTGLNIHNNVHDTSGRESAALSIYKHQTANTVTVSDSSLSSNTGIAVHLQKEIGVNSDISLDGLLINSHSDGLIAVVNSQTCSVANSSGSGNGSTSLGGCTDGGGNSFSN